MTCASGSFVTSRVVEEALVTFTGLVVTFSEVDVDDVTVAGIFVSGTTSAEAEAGAGTLDIVVFPLLVVAVGLLLFLLT